MDAGTPVLKPALAAAAVAIKAAAGKVVGGEFYNPGAAVAYVQLFDKALGGVVVGTDTPALSIAVPAGGRAPMPMGSVGFNTAITAAATAGPTNAVAPGTALVANFNVR